MLLRGDRAAPFPARTIIHAVYEAIPVFSGTAAIAEQIRFDGIEDELFPEAHIIQVFRVRLHSETQIESEFLVFPDMAFFPHSSIHWSPFFVHRFRERPFFRGVVSRSGLNKTIFLKEFAGRHDRDGKCLLNRLVQNMAPIERNENVGFCLDGAGQDVRIFRGSKLRPPGLFSGGWRIAQRQAQGPDDTAKPDP